ncbi:MAG: radical SAM protein [Methanolinea sp.]|nr:radical SAM protein [Methanolinea sp.]
MSPKSAYILDGYVDEPACLGVSPFISPYVRTLAGVLRENGYTVEYLTIDQVRGDPSSVLRMREAQLVVLIAGVTVPGKYLGGTPATLPEIYQLGSALTGPVTLITGPIGFGYSPGGGQRAKRKEFPGFDAFLSGSPASALDNFLREGKTSGTFDYKREDPWSVLGSDIIRKHPRFPWVMCEIETARGCARSLSGGCSFCTEPFYGRPVFRSIEGIAAEVRALSRAGGRHFRLGRQPDILVFGASPAGEYPSPVPEKIRELFSAVRDSSPDLATLHIDNVNPATVARHPDESRAALEAIVSFHTAGDVAAFGMESADPAVIAKNNLKAGPDEVMEAIRIVNEVGGRREGGIPHLLPGLNFIAGLPGETPRTYVLNRDFLMRVLASGYLVRRVNIRQLMPFEGTRAYTDNTLGVYQSHFRRFKDEVRRTFDFPMLQRVFPVGTVIRDVVIEEPGTTSFGRPMGSYPILVGIPLPLRPPAVIDVVIVDHGMRSVTALPCPIEVNSLPLFALSWIPGVGRRLAGKIAAKRPFSDIAAFRAVAGVTPLEHLFSFVRSPEAQRP